MPLYRHPAVLSCAVVAKPDARWGETPLAFVELRAGHRGHGGTADGPLPNDARQIQDPA